MEVCRFPCSVRLGHVLTDWVWVLQYDLHEYGQVLFSLVAIILPPG